MPTKDNTLHIVDLFNWIYRAHYSALGMTNASGFPTGAMARVSEMLWNYREKHNPEFMVLVRDPTTYQSKRYLMYPDYKSGRSEMPSDLVRQLPIIMELLKDLGFKIIVADEPNAAFEADDVIATLCRQAMLASDYDRVRILSNDKDLLQLLTYKRVEIMKGESDDLILSEHVHGILGVHPVQVPEFLALAGDASDSIPGVHLIGKKTAAELLNKYRSISGIYKNIEKVRGNKRRENLIKAKDDVPLYLALTRLMTDAPVVFDRESFRCRPPNLSKIEHWADNYGLTRLKRSVTRGQLFLFS